MKLNKDVLMKVGIVAAIALIVYLVYTSRGCKDGYDEYYSEYVPEDEYSENMYEQDAADYAEEEEYYEEPEEDSYEEEYPQAENYTLMESTLDDDEANAAFEPEM